MKPKEFLFKQKGYLYNGEILTKRDYRNLGGRKGTIYLSNTQIRIIFKNGGEHTIPLSTIKKLTLHNFKVPYTVMTTIPQILIQTDTNESYTFRTESLKKLYNLLSEVIANLSDGKDIHIGPRSGVRTGPRSGVVLTWCVWIIVIIGGIIGGLIFANLG